MDIDVIKNKIYMYHIFPCIGVCSNFNLKNHTELQIRRGIEDNSVIVFLISQQNHML